MQIIQAVRCAYCGTLHSVTDLDYIVLIGTAQLNGDAHKAITLGTNENPAIICQNTLCLQRAFRLITEEAYLAMLAKPQKKYNDQDWEDYE